VHRTNIFLRFAFLARKRRRCRWPSLHEIQCRFAMVVYERPDHIDDRVRNFYGYCSRTL